MFATNLPHFAECAESGWLAFHIRASKMTKKRKVLCLCHQAYLKKVICDIDGLAKAEETLKDMQERDEGYKTFYNCNLQLLVTSYSVFP
jgi:hypothetical protein